MNKDTAEQGCVGLVWVAITFILDLIFLIAFLIWKSKIALFLLGIGTVLLVITIVIFALWLHYLKRDLKHSSKR
jgi:ABC-type bacteriocin/lantibiotic exporter with double-glycine peptidase domain